MRLDFSAAPDHCCSPFPPDSTNLPHIGANVVCLRTRERENLAVHLHRGVLKIWSESFRHHVTTFSEPDGSSMLTQGQRRDLVPQDLHLRRDDLYSVAGTRTRFCHAAERWRLVPAPKPHPGTSDGSGTRSTKQRCSIICSYTDIYPA